MECDPMRGAVSTEPRSRPAAIARIECDAIPVRETSRTSGNNQRSLNRLSRRARDSARVRQQVNASSGCCASRSVCWAAVPRVSRRCPVATGDNISRQPMTATAPKSNPARQPTRDSQRTVGLKCSQVWKPTRSTSRTAAYMDGRDRILTEPTATRLRPMIRGTTANASIAVAATAMVHDERREAPDAGHLHRNSRHATTNAPIITQKIP